MSKYFSIRKIHFEVTVLFRCEIHQPTIFRGYQLLQETLIRFENDLLMMAFCLTYRLLKQDNDEGLDKIHRFYQRDIYWK